MEEDQSTLRLTLGMAPKKKPASKGHPYGLREQDRSASVKQKEKL